MKVCGQRQDAEDTMQEVLLKSVASLPKFGSPKALMVWLYKVAKNRRLMSRRKSKFAPKKKLSLEEQSKLRKDYQWKRKRARAEVLVQISQAPGPPPCAKPRRTRFSPLP